MSAVAALAADVPSLKQSHSGSDLVFVLVGRTYQHANRYVLVEGHRDPLPIHLRSSAVRIAARSAARAR